MHQSNSKGHHFFLVAPWSSFLLNSTLLNTHFNYFIFQCPALFALHFPVARPCLSQIFFPLIPGLPGREWDQNTLTGDLYLGGSGRGSYILGRLIFGRKFVLVSRRLTFGGTYIRGGLCLGFYGM